MTLPDTLLSLAGRVAVVAGGAGGIGSAIASLLRRAGATVVCLDRPGHEGPAGTRTIACDLTRSAEVDAALSGVRLADGRLDIVVHAAGTTRDGVIWKIADDDWADVMRVNLDSAFFLMRAAVPHLRELGGGAVVLVSSINGERGKVGQSNYAASKAGLNGLARSAAREVGRFGIRVNVVAPGWVDTAMTRALADEVKARARSERVLEAPTAPEDVAGVVLFLASPLARQVTGQVLRVDAGQLIG
ncbi:MAG: SDR family NAD(P)-dependent oxidoreductase [Vicinamibacterales bacterium]